MTLVVNEESVGVPAQEWKSSRQVADLSALELPRPRKVLLVAPHPDDEVLGAGGLVQKLLTAGTRLCILAVTDGEASHPCSQVVAGLDLGNLRSRESETALRRLGWSDACITRLRIPDGHVGEHVGFLEELLIDVLGPDDVCIAPWDRDGHPDHDACGRAASGAAQQIGARSLSYLVWALHWADPEGSDIPWTGCRRLDLSSREVARKRWATEAFRSQTRAIGPGPEDAPVLPAPVLRRFWLDHEIFVDSATSS